MLNKESLKATEQIFGILRLPKSSIIAGHVQRTILRFFTSIYLQGRKDQIDKIAFKVDPKGVVTFPDK